MDKDRPAITTAADRATQVAQEGGLVPRSRQPLPTNLPASNATEGDNDTANTRSEPIPTKASPEPRGLGSNVAAWWSRRNNQRQEAEQPERRAPNPPLPEDPTHTIGGSRYVDLNAPAGPLVIAERARAQADVDRALADIQARAGTVEQHTGGAIYQPVIPETRDDPQGGGNNQDKGRSTTDKIIPFLAEHKGKFFFVGSGLILGAFARAANVDPDILRGSIRIAAGAGGAIGASGLGEYVSHWINSKATDGSRLDRLSRMSEKGLGRLRQASMMGALAAGGVATEEFLSDPNRAIEALQQVPAELGGAIAHPIDTLEETWDNLTDALTPEAPTKVPAATPTAPGVTPTVPETPTVTATITPDTGLTSLGTPTPSGTPTAAATPTSTVTSTPTIIASPSPSATPGTGSSTPSTLPPIIDNPPGGDPGTGSSLPGTLPPIVDNPPGGDPGTGGSQTQIQPVNHIDPDRGWRERGPGFSDLPENKIDITPEYDFVINGNRVKGNLDTLTFNDNRWVIFENGEKNVNLLKQNHEIEGYHINPTRLKEELYPTLGLYGDKELIPGSFEYKLFHFANGTGTEFQDIFEDPEFEMDLKNRGILEIDRPDPTTIVLEEPVIPNHVDVDKGYIEKPSGYNDDLAVSPETEPYHKQLDVIAPYGGNKITGSIFDGTLKFGEKDWIIFENGQRHIEEITTLQNFTEPYYIDEERYKEELEKLIVLWSKGELKNPEDQKVFYLSDGVPGEYDKLKRDPAIIQTLKDRGIIKTR